MHSSIGFTGTKEGMNTIQLIKLKQTMEHLSIEATEVHHGSCIGADMQFHYVAESLGLRTHSHPCTLTRFVASLNADVTYDAKPPLDRNQDIVNSSDILIAAPKEQYEILRSGTWSTVRRARKKNIKIIKLLPNGIVEEID